MEQRLLCFVTNVSIEQNGEEQKNPIIVLLRSTDLNKRYMREQREAVENSKQMRRLSLDGERMQY